MLIMLGFALLIGLLLGVLGGGGSILTVPVLVYMLGIEPKTAIATSFVVVGAASVVAMVPHAYRGHICWKSALFFSLSGMVGAYAGGRLAGHFSDQLLMAVFGGVSLLTGLIMLFKRQPVAELLPTMQAVCPLQTPYLRLLFAGFWVGGLTGLVGVGGGFLIVPVLTMVVGLPISAAIGTSLLVILLNTVAGLMGYISHVDLNMALIIIVSSGAMLGSLLGSLLSGHIHPKWLRKGFAGLVSLIAVYVLSHSIG